MRSFLVDSTRAVPFLFAFALVVACGADPTNEDAAASADGIRKGQSCGDGICRGKETCSTCSSDCGQCPGTSSSGGSTPACGDGACQSGETCTSCAADCGACPPPSSLPAPTNDALWHGNADVDQDLGDQTLFMDKETGSLAQSRLSLVTDPLGLYGKVYRANLTAADINGGQNRAEWNEAFLGDGDTTLNVWGADGPGTSSVWIGWRSLFAGDVVIDTGHSNDGNYMQMKGDSSCGGPAVGMTIKRGRLTLRSEMYLTATDGVAWNGPLMTSLMNNAWHDIVLHINFAKDNVGYLEAWLDGVRQTMVNGADRIYFPTVCPNDTKVYPKWGVYGMDQGIGAGPIHHVESPRIGTSASSVVPR